MTPGRGTPESAGSRGSLPAAHAVPCGEGELPEKPLRPPLASARLRIIGLRKCLVPETVTVNLPGPDRRTGGNKIKVSGRLSGKMVLARACLGPADAGLCSRSA